MPYKFDSPIECPIRGCHAEINNTGALGSHLRWVHNITDGELRRYIVAEVKKRVLDGGDPIKLTIDEFREEYNRYKEELEREMQPQPKSSNENVLSDAKPIVPSPKVIAVVDQMSYDEYLKDDVEGEEGITIAKRKMPITVRPVSLTLAPEVFIYYDWVRSQGYKKSLSEFINETIKIFFRERGIGVGIVVISNE